MSYEILGFGLYLIKMMFLHLEVFPSSSKALDKFWRSQIPCKENGDFVSVRYIYATHKDGSIMSSLNPTSEY